MLLDKVALFELPFDEFIVALAYHLQGKGRKRGLVQETKNSSLNRPRLIKFFALILLRPS